MSRGLLVLILLFGGSLSAAEDDLGARAEAARHEAEAELAAGRERRLADHAALSERIAAAHQALAAARVELGAVAGDQARLRALADDAEAERARFERRREHLRERLERIAPAGTEPSAVLTERLADLRAASRLRIVREAVLDRQGEARELPVLTLGPLRLAAGGEPATSGLLRATADGGWVVAGPAPSAAGRAALRRLAAGEAARVPLDVEGSLAARAQAAAWTLGGWLAAGGWFVWPILLVALVALLLFAERLASLSRLSASPRLAAGVLEALRGGDRQAAQAQVADGRSPMARVLAAGIAAWDGDRAAREASLESALLAEELKLERGLKVLAVLAAVAPLLGLLGTVTGMIGTFDVIAVHGTGNPRLLSGGISEALITTQLGLVVAVPILVLHAVLGRVVERRQTRLEQGATALLGGERAEVAA